MHEVKTKVRKANKEVKRPHRQGPRIKIHKYFHNDIYGRKIMTNVFEIKKHVFFLRFSFGVFAFIVTG